MEEKGDDDVGMGGGGGGGMADVIGGAGGMGDVVSADVVSVDVVSVDVVTGGGDMLDGLGKVAVIANTGVVSDGATTTVPAPVPPLPTIPNHTISAPSKSNVPLNTLFAGKNKSPPQPQAPPPPQAPSGAAFSVQSKPLKRSASVPFALISKKKSMPSVYSLLLGKRKRGGKRTTPVPSSAPAALPSSSTSSSATTTTTTTAATAAAAAAAVAAVAAPPAPVPASASAPSGTKKAKLLDAETSCLKCGFHPIVLRFCPSCGTPTH